MAQPEAIRLAERYGAPNYRPLPVAVAGAEGCWVTDVGGRRYLDMLSAYSALNFGHRHPAIVDAAIRQMGRVTLTSRAVHSDLFGPFTRALAEICGMDMALPMNTGVEAVETAIKVSRKWGYRVKGIEPERALVVVCEDNFHGRTTTVVSFSSDPVAREDFGPFAPGFAAIPFGDTDALRALLEERADEVSAFIFEPIQGEAGVFVPPDGYLRAVRELCTRHNVLMVADEIQTGLGRTGHTFGCDAEGVTPDIYILGKALGGGIMPVSAVVSDSAILGLLTPGTHGSTFGGNHLACAIGLEVLRLIRMGEIQERSAQLGERMLTELRRGAPPAVREVRGRGLWAGLDVDPAAGAARGYCERLLTQGERGVIAKDTHQTTIRLAPPLVIEESDLEWGVERVLEVLAGERT